MPTSTYAFEITAPAGTDLEQLHEATWVAFETLLSDLQIALKPPVRAYLDQLRPFAAQKAMIEEAGAGAPYSSEHLLYAFPEMDGKYTIAATLLRHWIEHVHAELALSGAWAPVSVKPDRDYTETEKSAAFVLWGKHFTKQGKAFVSQGDDGPEPPKASFVRDLHQVWSLREFSGNCHCNLCVRLRPVGSGEKALQRLLAGEGPLTQQPLQGEELDRVFDWVARLRMPRTMIVSYALDAVPRCSSIEVGKRAFARLVKQQNFAAQDIVTLTEKADHPWVLAIRELALEAKG